MELLTARELRQTLKISKTTLYRLVQRGLPSIGEGRRRRFELGEVLKWMNNRGDTHTPPTLVRTGLYRCANTACRWVLQVTTPMSEDYLYCPSCMERSMAWVGLPWAGYENAKDRHVGGITVF